MIFERQANQNGHFPAKVVFTTGVAIAVVWCGTIWSSMAAKRCSNPLEKKMPHVIVKLWPGNSEQQKAQLADAIAKNVMDVLGIGEESVSVSMEEVEPEDWAEKVYQPDIVNKPNQLYKKPGYDASELP
jgi:4-oxalocrotonate tautomerase